MKKSGCFQQSSSAQFGEQTSTNQAYKYTGKPFDDEGGFDLYYYEARYYDRAGQRFISVDPLAGKYPGWSPYVYTLGNPIKYVDRRGEEPGDPFPSMDQAAIDFGTLYNDDSIRKKREFGTAIYRTTKDGSTVFSYEKPTTGDAKRVAIPFPRRSREYVAAAHTHGAYDPSYSSNELSDVDKGQSKSRTVYVATPNGSLKRYDPVTQVVTTISTDLPSDPNDPQRQNDVSPTTNTKDNQTRGLWDRIADFVADLL